MRFDRSGSFNVIDVCTNRKIMYDSLLVISCNLSTISPLLRDAALRIPEPTTPP